MIRFNFRRTVKDRIDILHCRGNDVCIFVIHYAVTGRNGYFCTRCRRRKWQTWRAVFWNCVKYKIVCINIFLVWRGGRRNFRRRRSVQSFPICGHADRNTDCRTGSDRRRTGESAEICIVDCVHVYIWIIVGRIDCGIQNFCCRAAVNRIEVYGTRKLNAKAWRCRHAAGRHLRNYCMCCRTVNDNAGLCFARAVSA